MINVKKSDATPKKGGKLPLSPPETSPVEPPLKVEKAAVESKVDVEYPDGGTSSETVQVAEVFSDEPLANVGMSIANTINLGNYENLKISVSLHHPSRREDIDETFQMVQDWVLEKMQQVHTQVMSEIEQSKVQAG